VRWLASGTSAFAIAPGTVRLDGGFDFVYGPIADTTVYTDNIILRASP
jgi:hypothetical protein